MIRTYRYYKWRLRLYWTAHAQPAFVRYYQRKIAAAKRQHKKTSHILAEFQDARHEAMRKEQGR